MAEDPEDLSVEREEEGQLVVQQLDKEILSRGAWATILFRYREWDTRRNDFGPDKFTIRRYRKVGGLYRQQSKLNLTSREQAARLVATLAQWLE